MRKEIGLILLAGIIVILSGCDDKKTRVAVKELRCEYLTNPLGIDVVEPRLCWILESAQRGEVQTAYQILAASSEEKLKKKEADLWDTGKVNSEQSIHIVYRGKKLQSRMRCWWQVRVWDKNGEVSEYSEPAWWEMGLLEKSDWKAKWIAARVTDGNEIDARPAPYFRKTFGLEKKIKSARAYICGLGFYELYLNGEKVGDHVLDPAYTRYDKRSLYATYDVTNMVKEGENAVGAVLGTGWYNMHTRAVWENIIAPWRNKPTVICQLEVVLADGTTKTIASDADWKVSRGGTTYDGIRNGEDYDARLEPTGWNKTGYNDSGWSAAEIVKGPKGELFAQMLPPVKIMKTIESPAVSEPNAGVFVVDMGQSMAGWAQIKLEGPAGTKVVMKYGEQLYKNGTLDQNDISIFIKAGPRHTDSYILSGKGTEVWEPRFVYHGFRYVQVEGFPGKLTAANIKGKVIYTSFEKTGDFECSNELFNKIQHCMVWSYISNFNGYPTDCPHREKNGWTGDAHLAAESGLYNFGGEAAYTKWMQDIKDEQRSSGEIAAIIPTAGWGYGTGNGPAWDSAYILIPWYLYQYCGDSRILAVHYERFKRYVDYLTGESYNNLVDIGLGDWTPVKEGTAVQVTSTGYYYCDAMIVSKIAALLGKDEDAKKYAGLAGKIKESFNKEFFKPQTSQYAEGTQTALSCALYQGMVEPENREAVVKNLVANVERHDGHLDAGILGTKYLLNTLTEGGRADVAYRIANQKTFPSWGHWVEQGATTLWEQWDGHNSRIHVMFGDISAWFYKYLAGIKNDPQDVGFKKIIIEPYLLGDINWVRAEHKSMYGLIKSSWRKNGDEFTLEVTIPANTTATVYMPAKGAEGVSEGGQAAAKSQGVRFLRMENGKAVFAVGSGEYKFVSKTAR